MTSSSLPLLISRRFLPLFMTQFLGALNDNLFKNGLAVLIVYGAADAGQTQLLVTLAAGLFILPFVLFSAFAGQLAEKYEKSRLITFVRVADIVLMSIAAFGFVTHNIYLLLGLLFCAGTVSTLFGPLKYAILPDLLKEDELIGGNGWIEAGTFLAILLGMIAGALGIHAEHGEWVVGIAGIIIAIISVLTSLLIPRVDVPEPGLKLNWNLWYITMHCLDYVREHRNLLVAVMAISWFWFVGATFIAQFPSYTKLIIHGNEQVYTLILALFSVGIAVGSALCNAVLKGRIVSTYAPLASLGITVFTLHLCWMSGRGTEAFSGELLDFSTFVSISSNWWIMLDLAGVSLCGGLYIVPLYTILQARSERNHRARTIASNNILNAVFMVSSAIVCMLLLKAGLTVTDIFVSVGIVNAIAAFWLYRKGPL